MFTELLFLPEAAVFLAYCGEETVGFVQCQLRHDYVEGTDSSPVGYLEGIPPRKALLSGLLLAGRLER